MSDNKNNNTTHNKPSSEKKLEKQKMSRRWGGWIIFLFVSLLAFFAFMFISGDFFKPNFLMEKGFLPSLEEKNKGIEKRFSQLETKVKDLETKIRLRQQEKKKDDTVEIVKNLVSNIQKMPEIQEKLSNLKTAIETGKPFDKEYEAIKPYINLNDAQKDQIKGFIKMSNVGVKTFENLEKSFQEVAENVLFQLPKHATWIDKFLNFFKTLFSIRPQARIVKNPQTSTDYVLTLEALLKLKDKEGIVKLLEHTDSIKNPDFVEWREEFQNYYQALSMHKMLSAQAYSLNFERL